MNRRPLSHRGASHRHRARRTVARSRPPWCSVQSCQPHVQIVSEGNNIKVGCRYDTAYLRIRRIRSKYVKGLFADLCQENTWQDTDTDAYVFTIRRYGVFTSSLREYGVLNFYCEQGPWELCLHFGCMPVSCFLEVFSCCSFSLTLLALIQTYSQ